jgi:hypothetical protein
MPERCICGIFDVPCPVHHRVIQFADQAVEAVFRQFLGDNIDNETVQQLMAAIVELIYERAYKSLHV